MDIDAGLYADLPPVLQRRHVAIREKWTELRRELCRQLFNGDDSVRPTILNMDSAIDIAGRALIESVAAHATLKCEQIIGRMELAFERFELAAASQNGRK